jgi:hypothetical protein
MGYPEGLDPGAEIGEFRFEAKPKTCGALWLSRQVLEFADPNMGYNAATGEFCDMVKAGVIDPLKVGLWPFFNPFYVAMGMGFAGRLLQRHIARCPVCRYSVCTPVERQAPQPNFPV